MMRWSDYHYPGDAYTVITYQKPATVLHTLHGLLGPDAFEAAYREFVRRWALKHPQPWDLFNTFSDVTGEDLDWFWRGWYYENWMLDHAIETVSTSGSAHRITVSDRGLMPMPARMAITLGDGTVVRREVPVELWLSGRRQAVVEVDTDDEVVRVELDPERRFPDVNRANDVWERDR